MSLYDLSKLSGAPSVRGVGRELGRDLAGSKAASTAAPQRAAPVADQGVSVETGSRISAGSVPKDQDRVAEIRNALRDGSYPIVPAKITDALIAARLMLSNGQ